MLVDNIISKSVVIILVAASLFSWFIIIERLIVFHIAKKFDNAFIKDSKSKKGYLYRIYEEINQVSEECDKKITAVAESSINHQRMRLEGLLPILAIIGNIAPYIGLFGTVIGLIQAFQSIQASNDMSPAIVASGITTALLTTAIGLAVAIPSVTAYQIFKTSVDRRMAIWEDKAKIWLTEIESREV